MESVVSSPLSSKVRLTDPRCVAEAIRMNQQIILLDARPFVEYNTSHVTGAFNLGGTRAFRRKFLRNEVPLEVFLTRLTNLSYDVNLLTSLPIVIYDQSLDNLRNLRPDCFLHGVLLRIVDKFSATFLIKGGFLRFQLLFPELCWENSKRLAGDDVVDCNPSECQLECLLDDCSRSMLIGTSVWSVQEATDTEAICTFSSSVSQPQLSVPSPYSTTDSSLRCGEFRCHSSLSTHPHPSISDHQELISPGSVFRPRVVSSLADFPPPSAVLPHVFLGSQVDAMSQTICQQYNITHVINVSVDEPASKHIQPENFHRIPVNDNYTDSIRSFFDEAFAFIDKVKADNGRVLIHCSAGISRSPTLAIAYLMFSFRIPMRKAYNFIKTVRSTIAPNFNFLGQLLDFELELFHTNPTSSCLFLPLINNQMRRLSNPLSSESSESNSPFKSEALSAVRMSVDPVMKYRLVSLTPTVSMPRFLSSPKKRERPTHLSLNAYADVHKADRQYQQSVDISLIPTDCKRSRVSPVRPHSKADNLLPSPCTVFSRLVLSSPSEERDLTSPSVRVHDSVSQIKPSSGVASALASFSLTSLDKLHFQPCTTPCAQTSCSTDNPSRSTWLQHSSTFLGVHSIRPMLLAERNLSSQFTAPTVPPVFVQKKSSITNSLPISPIHDYSSTRSNWDAASVAPAKCAFRCRTSQSADAVGIGLQSSSDDPPLFSSSNSQARPRAFSMSAFACTQCVSLHMTHSCPSVTVRSCASMERDLVGLSTAPFGNTWLPFLDTSSCRQQEIFRLSSSSSSNSNLSTSSAGHNIGHNGSCFNLYSIT